MQISARKLTGRIDPEGLSSELQPLCIAFNSMLDRLHDSVKRLFQFFRQKYQSPVLPKRQFHSKKKAEQFPKAHYALCLARPGSPQDTGNIRPYLMSNWRSDTKQAAMARLLSADPYFYQ